MMMSLDGRLMRIGALARAVALSTDTLRHYEKLGLLCSARRTRGGFREYPPEAVRRVQTIQAALEIGFTLKELGDMFRERAAGRPPCRKARALAGEKLAELDRELARLRALRLALRSVIGEWDARLARATPGTAALLLESLVDSTVRLTRRASEDAVRSFDEQTGTLRLDHARAGRKRVRGRR